MRFFDEASNAFKRGDDLWEYLLVAHPDEAVNEKIVEEKKFFHQLFEQEIAIRTKPHITVANFLAKERMEETLERWIQNICSLQASFTVSLNNYSGFPPHTIYLRVQDAQPFQKLANALKILDPFIRANDCPPLHLVTRPHLTIARRLPQHVYDEAIRTYAERSFYESFKVEKLLLLKRDAYRKCSVVNTFTLPPPLTLFE